MNYQQTVQQLLMGYAQNKPAYGDIEVETIFDTHRTYAKTLSNSHFSVTSAFSVVRFP